jgi:putative effector of murein hydrolase
MSQRCRGYMDGPAQFFISPLGPAIATLGMLTHTHRHVIKAQWRGIVASCLLGAPLGLGFAAIMGPVLGLGPREVRCAFFRHKSTREAAIGCHACSLEAIMRATNGIRLGCSRLLPVGTVKCLQPLKVASVLPATTTTGLALTMAPALPASCPEWIPIGTVFCGVGGMCVWPLLLRVTGLHRSTALVRGFAVGSVSHVSGVAGLTAAGELAAADAAAIAMFLLGTLRCVLLQLPGVSAVLGVAEPDLEVLGVAEPDLEDLKSCRS